MGADRLKKIKDEAKRGWNAAGQRLSNPEQLSFFDNDPLMGRPSFKVLLKKNASASKGDELLLQSVNDNQFITRGPEIVGECDALPGFVKDQLKISGVICIEVIGVGSITDTLEVAPK